MVVKINYLPLLPFLRYECPFLWLDWFLRVDSHLDYFLTHAGTLHGKIHVPIQIMSTCVCAAVSRDFSPLPKNGLML